MLSKPIDWSQARRNKFAGRKLTIAGDRRKNNPPPTGKYIYRFEFGNGSQLEVQADNERAARQWVLAYFKWQRMPRGVNVERIAEAA